MSTEFTEKSAGMPWYGWVACGVAVVATGGLIAVYAAPAIIAISATTAGGAQITATIVTGAAAVKAVTS